MEVVEAEVQARSRSDLENAQRKARARRLEEAVDERGRAADFVGLARERHQRPELVGARGDELPERAPGALGVQGWVDPLRLRAREVTGEVRRAALEGEEVSGGEQAKGESVAARTGSRIVCEERVGRTARAGVGRGALEKRRVQGRVQGGAVACLLAQELGDAVGCRHD